MSIMYELDGIMQMNHVIEVRPDNTIDDKSTGVYAPEIIIEYDGPFAEAQISDDQERDMITYAKSQGWDILTGWAMGGGLAIMHQSQFIGGAVEEHVRMTPGYWVACAVEIYPGKDDPEHENNGGNDEPDLVGWVLAHREDA